MKIALIAHDKKKGAITDLAVKYKDVLEGHELYATGTTGTLIMGETGLTIERMKSGPLGGDQQIGSMVADGQPIGKLEIDAATGAGTLKGVNFNDSGMINIVNWNTESLYDGLSFSLEDSYDVENLEKWIVYKDGQPTKRIVCYRDGRLYLKPKGLSVRVR